MLLAVVVTLFDRGIVSFEVIIAGLISGALVGLIASYRVPMTAMPQLVALFNGFGGGASAIAIGAALQEILHRNQTPNAEFAIPAIAGGLIGGVTLTGSGVALMKLQGWMTEKPVLIPGRHVINVMLAFLAIGLGVWFAVDPSVSLAFWLMCGVAVVLGLLLVLPIGGADMPVVISLLNSYSGLAAAGHGFVVQNSVLIVAGSLVGASGFIMTAIMSRAMNRPLSNVLFGGVGASAVSASEAEEIYAGKVKSTDPEEVAILLADAQRVVIVPGYGMAVGRAQHAIKELSNLLEARGTTVEFGIHPVAGRMPGHMNVLLAEAEVAYDRLKDMDQINPTFQETDVVLVVGANDVVNPLAREADPSIPIAGMPILNVDQARVVVVIKRSLSPGFAGIPNPLFAADNALMLFGDAKQMALDLVVALKRA